MQNLVKSVNVGIKQKYYQHIVYPPRRLYSWKLPDDTLNNVIRNQIDFIFITVQQQPDLTEYLTRNGHFISSQSNGGKDQTKEIKCEPKNLSMVA